MALPPTYDLVFYAGDNETFSMNWKNADGTPVEGLEFAEAHLTVALNIKEPPLLVKLGTVSSITGNISFDFTPEETSALIGDDDFSRKNFLYDVQLTYKDNMDVVFDVKTIVRGKLTVVEDITKYTGV